MIRYPAYVSNTFNMAVFNAGQGTIPNNWGFKIRGILKSRLRQAKEMDTLMS